MFFLICLTTIVILYGQYFTIKSYATKRRITGNDMNKNENNDYCQTNLGENNKTNGSSYRIKINLVEYDIDQIEDHLVNKSIEFGGRYSPKTCKSEQRIAIIIPYRDRLSNLKLFLSNMHPFLINQNLTYGIYLIEPLANLTFNRGLLMNIGFIESLKESNNLWDCFFFHDVDMLPEDLRNYYKCDYDLPVHYAVSVAKYNYE